MKGNRKYIRPALSGLLLAGILLNGGCVKRELEIRPDEGFVEIALDWGGDTRPKSARYLFYDETGKLVKEETGVTDGFKGVLPTGTYRLVVHNTDARQVDYRGTDSYETAEVFARQTDYTDGHHPVDGVSCILEPQLVFGTGYCKEFDKIVVKQSDTTRATVNPVLLTKEVRFEFIIKSDESVQSLSGVLGGVTPGIFLSSGKYNGSSPCAIEFTAAPKTKAAALDFTARMSVFNLLTTNGSPTGTNIVNVALTLVNGDRLHTSFDLTGTLQDIIGSGSNGQIPIDIPIEVTLEVQPVEGLRATVTHWDNSGTGGGDPRPQP